MPWFIVLLFPTIVQYMTTTANGNSQTSPHPTPFHSITPQVVPTPTSKLPTDADKISTMSPIETPEIIYCSSCGVELTLPDTAVSSYITVSMMATAPGPKVTSSDSGEVVGVIMGVSVTFVTVTASTVVAAISVIVCVRRKRRRKQFISTANVAYNKHSRQITLTTKSSDTEYAYTSYSYPDTHPLTESSDLIAYASVLPKGGDWTSESCNTEGLALNVAYGVQSTHSAAYGDEVELSGNVSHTLPQPVEVEMM